jgi:hypothetical protein
MAGFEVTRPGWFQAAANKGTSAKDLDGSFWDFSVNTTGPIPLNDVLKKGHLASLLRTMRNGFQHFHWRFENLSALDYWNTRQWSIIAPHKAFNLAGRPKKNYMAYVADAFKLNPARFWKHKDLRILVTPYGVLRYHLHLMMNHIINGSRKDIFGSSA